MQEAASPPIQPTSDGAQDFELFTSRQFVNWMAEQRLSVGFSTYQSGKVFLLGINPRSELSVFERTFNRPMGMWCDGQVLWLSTLYETYRFTNILEAGTQQDEYDCLFVPQVSYITGDIDVHDLAVTPSGQLFFANTLFSCLSTTDEHFSFTPHWQPPFISKLAAEDRCHLNGLALRDGKPRYMTAVAAADIVDGWRGHRADGGIVMDIAANEIIAGNLSMPHSPRWHRDKLWVANSGAGEFGFIDQKSGKFECVAFCPGYIRGVAMQGDYAILGLSKPRQNKTFQGLPLDQALEKHNTEAHCGLYVIDLRSGDIVHWLKVEGMVSELYDVVMLPQVKRSSMIGFRNDQIRRTLSVGPMQSLD